MLWYTRNLTYLRTIYCDVNVMSRSYESNANQFPLLSDVHCTHFFEWEVLVRLVFAHDYFKIFSFEFQKCFFLKYSKGPQEICIILTEKTCQSSQLISQFVCIFRVCFSQSCIMERKKKFLKQNFEFFYMITPKSWKTRKNWVQNF